MPTMPVCNEKHFVPVLMAIPGLVKIMSRARQNWGAQGFGTSPATEIPNDRMQANRERLVALTGQGYLLVSTQGGLLGSVGQQQQTQNQTDLTNAYNAWLAQQSQNAGAQNLLNSSLGLIPVQQTTNSSNSSTGTGQTQTTTDPGLVGILNAIGNIAKVTYSP
jgi:hypothetical protein